MTTLAGNRVGMLPSNQSFVAIASIERSELIRANSGRLPSDGLDATIDFIPLMLVANTTASALTTCFVALSLLPTSTSSSTVPSSFVSTLET